MDFEETIDHFSILDRISKIEDKMTKAEKRPRAILEGGCYYEEINICGGQDACKI